MLFRRRKTSPAKTSCPSLAQRDESAYTVLEEARIRCESMLAQTQSESESRWLKALYRELGTAGFLASENIASHRRVELLELARRQAGAPVVSAREPLGALLTLARHAGRAVEQALIAPGLSEHMLCARQHLVAAIDLLDDRRQRPRPGVGAEVG